MTLYAVMFTETDGCEYSVDICLGVYDSEEKAENKIERNIEEYQNQWKNSKPHNFGLYREEYYILEHNLNEDW